LQLAVVLSKETAAVQGLELQFRALEKSPNSIFQRSLAIFADAILWQ